VGRLLRPPPRPAGGHGNLGGGRIGRAVPGHIGRGSPIRRHLHPTASFHRHHRRHHYRHHRIRIIDVMAGHGDQSDDDTNAEGPLGKGGKQSTVVACWAGRRYRQQPPAANRARPLRWLRSGMELTRFRGLVILREKFPMPRNRQPYSSEFRRQVVGLVRAGRTPEELARDFVGRVDPQLGCARANSMRATRPVSRVPSVRRSWCG
jgi:hypothetical protein